MVAPLITGPSGQSEPSSQKAATQAVATAKSVGSYISHPPPLVIILGIPLAIVLGGTRFGPIINLSLVAVLIGTVLTKGK